MRIAVSGSIATDHLMTFRGRFAEQLLADRLESISLSFLVDGLEIRRGGVAANVCYGMALLGGRPVLVGGVGEDGKDYMADLESIGVDLAGVVVDPVRHTARFVCTTDADQNQLASFYPGAMDAAADIALEQAGQVDLLVVAPNNPQAMSRHSQQARDAGLPFAADPSQQLAWLDGAGVRELVEGAQYLFTNDYELGLVVDKTGWSQTSLLDHVHTRVTTHGKAGVSVVDREHGEQRIDVVPTDRVAEPTGVGDGFRAGFLTGLAGDLPLLRCAQLGAATATLVVETVGPQGWTVEPEVFAGRIAAAYGDDAAAEISSALGWS